MMPVVRVSDAAFGSLKTIAKWNELETPSQVIDRLVQNEMNRLDLAMEHEEESYEQEHDGTVPGLSFTRIRSASVNGSDIQRPKWNGLLLDVVRRVRAKGFAGEKLVNELNVPAKAGAYDEQGYRFQPDLGISLQGQSASDAWREIDRLANKHQIPIEVFFQWRDNLKAARPNQTGVLRAGQ